MLVLVFFFFFNGYILPLCNVKLCFDGLVMKSPKKQTHTDLLAMFLRTIRCQHACMTVDKYERKRPKRSIKGQQFIACFSFHKPHGKTVWLYYELVFAYDYPVHFLFLSLQVVCKDKYLAVSKMTIICVQKVIKIC